MWSFHSSICYSFEDLASQIPRKTSVLKVGIAVFKILTISGKRTCFVCDSGKRERVILKSRVFDYRLRYRRKQVEYLNVRKRK